MPKKVCAQNYQNAYDVLYGEWLSISPTDHYDIDDKGFPLTSDSPSLEQTVIKNDAFKALSAEAKEIISTVLFTPIEIIDLISTPKTKKITLRKIKRYFTEKWKSPFIVEITLKEISTWISKL